MDWNHIAETLRSRPPQPMGTGTSSAVLVLLAGERLVLEVRARTLRHQPGEICLPGGGMEPGETPEACALRETEEELGLSRARVQVIGPLDFAVYRNRRIVYPVLARMKESDLVRFRPNPQEVEEVFTVPLDWFRGHPPVSYEYDQRPVGLERLPKPMADCLRSYSNLRRGVYWLYEGRLIWGLTASIIGQLLKLTEGGREFQGKTEKLG